jgi:DNA-binding response OmpR family regulator
MPNAGFLRWQNPDSTADVICLGCFRTVASSQAQDEIATAEANHTCNPFDDLGQSQLESARNSGMMKMKLKTGWTARPRILLVDDDEMVRELLRKMLEMNEFHVTMAANVPEALHRIDTESFDVLVSDLHMPGAGDGFTVISAMRHKHPNAVTLLFTGYPALKEAMDAILLQADEILVKPMPIPEMVDLIRERLDKRGTKRPSCTERVASILERDALITIANWLAAVKTDGELSEISLSDEQRTGHLPQLIRELVYRLRVPRSLGTKQISEGAVMHGKIRRSQGYSIPMIVEESRILQVSIFNTLQTNLRTVDFSLLLIDVMTIADEVDSQLKQTIVSFSESPSSVAA